MPSPSFFELMFSPAPSEHPAAAKNAAADAPSMKRLRVTYFFSMETLYHIPAMRCRRPKHYFGGYGKKTRLEHATGRKSPCKAGRTGETRVTGETSDRPAGPASPALPFHARLACPASRASHISRCFNPRSTFAFHCNRDSQCSSKTDYRHYVLCGQPSCASAYRTSDNSAHLLRRLSRRAVQVALQKDAQ